MRSYVGETREEQRIADAKVRASLIEFRFNLCALCEGEFCFRHVLSRIVNGLQKRRPYLQEMLIVVQRVSQGLGKSGECRCGAGCVGFRFCAHMTWFSVAVSEVSVFGLDGSAS